MASLSVPEASVEMVESVTDGHIELPGGLLSGGQVYRFVTVRQLTGADEEVLADRSYRNPAQQATEFLTRAITGFDGLNQQITRDVVKSLLIGDRDYLVLRLRQMVLGDLVEQVVRCPAAECGRKADVEFLISELSVRRAEALQAEYEVMLSEPAFADDPLSTSVTVRLPCGADQEAALNAAPNAAAMNTVLFARIVRKCGHRQAISEEESRRLPFRVRHELREFLRREAPGPDLTIEVQCPHCGEDLSYPFDLQSFFLPAR